MKNVIVTYRAIGYAVVTGMFISQVQVAKAGWTGLINGAGIGYASVNVKSFKGITNVVTPNNLQFPSAAVSPATGYTYSGALPRDASPNTYSRIKGQAGGIWQAATYASVGDSTDDPELEQRFTVIPVKCASLEVSTVQESFDENSGSGTIAVTATATAGTALLLRGYEYMGDPSDVPADDPETPENEAVEYLKSHDAVLLFENAFLGPGQYGGGTLENPRCALIIPFTLEHKDTSHFYFAVNGVAKTLPFQVICPPDTTIRCDGKTLDGTMVYSYPDVTFNGGCGTVNLTYSPSVGSLVLGDNIVTVTATDGNGDMSTCTFKVTKVDQEVPVISATGTPANGVLAGFNPTLPQIEAALGTATATDNCGSATPTAGTGGVNVDGCARSQTRTWNVSDAAGNPATPVSRTVTWTEDQTPPVAPVLPKVTGHCGQCLGSITLTAPKTTDNCSGQVTGTTTTQFPITAAGTTLVTWTFTDAAGNFSTATQTVILDGLEFDGFESPIGGTGGSWSVPKLDYNQSKGTLPIKFEVECEHRIGEHNYVHPGQSKLEIFKGSDANPPLLSTSFVAWGDDYHYNWTVSNNNVTPKGIYKIVATLPDGTKREVYIRLK